VAEVVRVQRYPALKLMVSISNILAWVMAALFFVAGLAALTAGLPGVLGLIFSWLMGFLSWLGVRSYAELIQVFVSIEENTRSARPGAG